MKIALSTDHAGFEQLKQIKTFLVSEGHTWVDFGPEELDPADDYPDFIFPAAHAVVSGECEFGIILGRSGQGEAMAANRVKGARCAVFYGSAVPKQAVDASGEISEDPYEVVRRSRLHNDANMLSLAAVYLDEEEIQTAIRLWLSAPFDGGRHARRVQKLDELS